MTVEQIVCEGLLVHEPGLSVAQRRERVVVALADVGLVDDPRHGSDWLQRYPHEFSGGQRQRLAIARALVKRPSVYIFDDSFSALDFKTDAALRSALAHDTHDATVIIVAQRVSTIMHADQIVVLDEGTIVGIGTHEELMKTSVTYREIVQSQLTEEEVA
jgi:ABC-type bacteriocin/lantibiotic exporter with double-glycine peptidase domain